MERGVLPNIGYVGMCGPKGYCFSAFLVIDRVSLLAMKKGWFLHSSPELDTVDSPVGDHLNLQSLGGRLLEVVA